MIMREFYVYSLCVQYIEVVQSETEQEFSCIAH
jgi:hypothetical protein